MIKNDNSYYLYMLIYECQYTWSLHVESNPKPQEVVWITSSSLQDQFQLHQVFRTNFSYIKTSGPISVTSNFQEQFQLHQVFRTNFSYIKSSEPISVTSRLRNQFQLYQVFRTNFSYITSSEPISVNISSSNRLHTIVIIQPA